jgi:ribonuclease HI
VKINWDAAVDSSNKIIGLGMIARDESGKFLAACSKRQSINVEPMVAEALAAIQAILFCQEHNFQKVIFEGDSLQVVKEVNMSTQCNSSYGHLIESIKVGLRQIPESSFTHVRRSANTAAHTLAVMAKTHVIDVVGWNLIPPHICGIVQREELFSPS